MTLGLVESLKNSDFVKESKMTERKKKVKSKFSTTKSTKCYVKSLFQIAHSTAYSTQLFTDVLYDCDSKSIRKFPGKASSYIAFFNVQHTVLENKIAAY